MLDDHIFVVILRIICVQSYRKAVTAARKDKKAGRPPGLTEEQKQEIRYASTALQGGVALMHFSLVSTPDLPHAMLPSHCKDLCVVFASKLIPDHPGKPSICSTQMAQEQLMPRN